jgi:hypothetical protein
MTTNEEVDAAFDTLTGTGWRPKPRRGAAAKDDVRAALDAALEVRARLRATAPPRQAEGKRQARWKHVPAEMRPADMA